MATCSGASSSTGSRAGGRTQAAGQPLCPFCRTETVVERTSRTLKNPDKQFYTCKNRDWGNSKCDFFMWKPVGDGDDAATMLAGLKALESSLLDLSKAVAAYNGDVSRLVGQQRKNVWMNVANVFVGVASFVVLCVLMYKQA